MHFHHSRWQYVHMHLCLCADVCVRMLWTCLGSAFAKIYTNCCLNTQGPPRPFHPTQHSTTRRPSNKAFRIVSFPVGPLDNPHNPLHQPHSVPALPRLCMRHGSMDDRLMRRKYFYRIAFRRSNENQWQHFYGHQLADWALLSLYLLWSLWAGMLLQTTAHWLTVKAVASNLGLKTPPQTSSCKT